MLTAERIRSVLAYEAETGFLLYSEARRGMRKNQIGKQAGALNADGYLMIHMDGKRYQAHRLAWLHVHGEWPEHEIDHINGCRSDNRMCNLRDVTRRVNSQNLRRSMPKRLADAPLGVSWHRVCKKWRAMIWNGSKNIYLGLFDDPAEAHRAYIDAKRRLHQGCTI